MNKLQMPSITLTFKVEENDYKVKYPNTGGLLQMQSLKHSLSGNQYNEWTQGVTLADQHAQHTADMIAFLIVCCPEMKTHLKVNTFSDLDAVASKKLMIIYVKVIKPWLNSWEVFLNTDETEEQDEQVDVAAE